MTENTDFLTSPSRKPLIGISGSLLTIDSGSYFGRERVFVGRDYIIAVEQSGGIPLVLPPVSDLTFARRYIETVDGLLLSGGHDVHPFRYGEEPSPKLDIVSVERDSIEIELIKLAALTGKPIFGICRGLQLINVAFGGTLFQDIPTDLPGALQHSQKFDPAVAVHTIDISPDSHLRRVIGSDSIATNSFHHQTIKKIAPDFIPVAKTRDGIIEAMEHRHPDTFIRGVQWHPELMIEVESPMRNLFREFVNRAGRKKS